MRKRNLFTLSHGHMEKLVSEKGREGSKEEKYFVCERRQKTKQHPRDTETREEKVLSIE